MDDFEYQELLVKSGKIVLDASGDVLEVKQNSGYPSALFNDLVEIANGDRQQALTVYVSIKNPSQWFKKKFGDWENQIMREYSLAGFEYRTDPNWSPDADDPYADQFAWSDDGGGIPVIRFNIKKLSRKIPFEEQKASFRETIVDEMELYRSRDDDRAYVDTKRYLELYDKHINTNRDLKLHLIHIELFAIMNAGLQITVDDIENNYIRSVNEVHRLSNIDLAKDYFGEPMLYMHAGKQGISKFIAPGDPGYVKRDKFTGAGGIYFNRDLKMIDKYSGFSNGKPADGKDIYYAFLRMKRPFYILDEQAQSKHKLENSITLTESDLKAITENGYDGIIWDREELPGKAPRPKLEAVVFKGAQVALIGSYRTGLWFYNFGTGDMMERGGTVERHPSVFFNDALGNILGA